MLRTYAIIPLLGWLGAMFAAGENGDVPQWAQYGVLGLVVIGLVFTGQLVPGRVHTDLKTQLAEAKAETREARAETKAVNQQMLESMQATIPALRDAASVVQQAMPLVQEALRVRDQRRGG